MTTRAQLEKYLLSAAARKAAIDERIRVMRAALRRKSPAALRVKQPNPLKRARRAKKNPVKPHLSQRQANVVRAIQLYQRFRVQEPRFVDELNVEFHGEMLEVGKCIAVEYDTRRNGKPERYRHEFTGQSRPILAASYDGKQLYFLKGRYNFTDRGIVDRK